MQPIAESEQRLLSELEESGEYDLVHLINVTTAATGATAELEALSQALKSIVLAGFATVGLQRFSPRSLEPVAPDAVMNLLNDLGSILEYGAYGPYWHYRDIDIRKEKYPTVLITDSGLSKAREIMSTRGYRWWSPRRKR